MLTTKFNELSLSHRELLQITHLELLGMVTPLRKASGTATPLGKAVGRPFKCGRFPEICNFYARAFHQKTYNPSLINLTLLSSVSGDA